MTTPFDSFLADLDSQPITGFDHYGNRIHLELITHVIDNLYVGGHSRSVYLGDFFSHVFSFYPFEAPYGRDHETVLTEYKMLDSHKIDWMMLEKATRDIVAALEAGGNVLVHCQAGINRSNLAATRVLMERYDMTAEDAIALLRGTRGPVVLSNPAFERYLLSLDA